jgi:hypothetical protein
MKEVPGANIVALTTKQARSIRDNEGEPMSDKEAGDTTETEGAKGEGDIIMAETAGEIEIEMGAGASNDSSSPARLGQVKCFRHGGAGDWSGTKNRFRTVAGAAEGKRRNLN